MEKVQATVLMEKAREAAQYAHAPYSHYPVGAALLTETGEIFTGCNVESSSFGLTVCAERNAIAAALVAGFRSFHSLAIFSENGAAPCGACRQVIWDICGNIDIYLMDAQGEQRHYRMVDLFPLPFDNNKLKEAY